MATKEKPAKEKRTIRIIGERNICLHLSNPNHRDRIIRVGKALSSSTRLQILDMLKTTPRSLQEIASFLCCPSYQDFGRRPAHCHGDSARHPRFHASLYLQYAVLSS